MQNIKTILCPIDFSESSEYGLDYAAHLAKIFFADIRLVYVRTSIWPEASQLEHDAGESIEDISRRLAAFCHETSKEFGIICTHHVVTTTNTIEQAIADESNACDLIVMGTNGADNFYKCVFGGNTFHVIEKIKCPVFVVPKGYLFRSIRSLVYAHHPDTNPIFLMDQLKSFIAPMNVEVKVVHVAKENPSADERHRLDILRDAVMARKLKGKEWGFDSLHSQDVAWALHQYMENHKTSVLALAFHRRKLIEDIFTQNVVKQLTLIAGYPMFIFWH